MTEERYKEIEKEVCDLLKEYDNMVIKLKEETRKIFLSEKEKIDWKDIHSKKDKHIDKLFK